MEEKKNVRFTEGKIFPALIRFTLPILAASLLQAMYGAVDMLIIGRFGDASSVSAVSNGSQLMMTLMGLIMNLSTGMTILVGQRTGARDEQGVTDAVGSSLCLFGLLGAVSGVIGMLFARTFVAWLDTPVEAFEKAVDYVRICSAGMLFIAAYNLIGAFLRGIGDSKLPLLFAGVSCGVNILGDLLLVGALRMDAAGAALATVGAQLVSVIFSLFYMKKKGMPVKLRRQDIRFGRSTGTILRLGAPIAAQEMLTSVSFLILAAIFNGLGVVASAAAGVADRVVMFIMLIPISFMSSISAFVAQNIGAEKPERARKALLCAIGTSVAYGAVMTVIAFLFGGPLCSIFTTEAEVIASGADYMRAYAIDCLLVAFAFCFMGYFNGCGRTTFVMLQGLAGTFLVRIPLSFLISRSAYASLFTIALASPAATLVQIILCTIWFAVTEKQRRRTAA